MKGNSVRSYSLSGHGTMLGGDIRMSARGTLRQNPKPEPKPAAAVEEEAEKEAEEEEVAVEEEAEEVEEVEEMEEEERKEVQVEGGGDGGCTLVHYASGDEWPSPTGQELCGQVHLVPLHEELVQLNHKLAV
jgi:hypothetical protein